MSSGTSAGAIAKDSGWPSGSVRQRVAAIKRGDPAPRYVGSSERRLTPELLDEIRDFIDEEHAYLFFFFLCASHLRASFCILWLPYCVHSVPLCDFRRSARRRAGASLAQLPFFVSCLCLFEDFHAWQPASVCVTFFAVKNPQQSPESSIWPHIGTKSGGRISSVSSHASSIELRLSPFAVGRGIKVTSHDVYVVQLSDFPELTQQHLRNSPLFLRSCCSSKRRPVRTSTFLASAPSCTST